jgi:hypothetical protein
MKIIICLVIGVAVGAFGMKYHDDAAFAKHTNAHINAAVAQTARNAHQVFLSSSK